MRPSKAHFVTLCQQALALGVVLAMLGPAAGVVSLDVVVRPGAETSQPRTGTEAGGASGGALGMSLVASGPVEPEVAELPLKPGRPAELGHGRAAPGTAEFVSEPREVEGMTTIGVTWNGAALEEDQIQVMARTRTAKTWSDWTEIEYHDEHQPDPGSAEARGARAGTEPLIVGEVDQVQTRVVTRGGAVPRGLTMAVIAPGQGESVAQAPAIDTAEPGAAPEPATLESSDGEIALSASTVTSKPRIYSRAQWGADESLRDRSSLRYYEVHAGFVHHTVNANAYTADQVPGILRSIYAYHTRSRGWSDIGYNFLLDRFGRVWEGRYGGVDRPVVGAHTAGYNDYAFAASAIGNFEEVRPTSAMVDAYGRLLAWKLSLHGVDATSTSQRVGDRTFPAINGHRDAGSTACPGRYLYEKLPAMRSIAASAQTGWTGRDRQTSITGDFPDLVLRRTRDGRAVILPTGGMMGFTDRVLYDDWSAYKDVVPTPDVTGDGRADVLVRMWNGRAAVRPGTGKGTFRARIAFTGVFKGYWRITAVGDLDGDGNNDIVAQHRTSGRLALYSGDGSGGFTRSLLAERWPYALTVATGDITGDGKPDLLGRDAAGVLWVHPGTGRRALGARSRVAGTHWGRWTDITGFGDFTRDGRPDLLVRTAVGTAFVLPGNGRGGFGHQIGPFSSAKGLDQLWAVDIDGGGDADIAGFRGVRYVAQDHNGRQNTLPAVVTGAGIGDANLALNVGDFDRDGPSDVVVRLTNGDLMLHRGLATGALAAPVRIATGFANVRLLAAVGDVTGDGFPDLMGQPGTGAMRIYPGRGTGLRPSYVAHSAVSAAKQVGLGLWNGDGAPDSGFLADGRLTWMKGNGPGGLTGARQGVGPDLSGYDWVLSAGDVDGRHGPDLVVRQRGLLWLLPSTAAGGFGARRFLTGGVGGYDLAG